MELLPVPYFHVVFTLPSQIFPKFWDPKKKGLSPVKGPRPMEDKSLPLLSMRLKIS
jgi:hypothetical protein